MPAPLQRRRRWLLQVAALVAGQVAAHETAHASDAQVPAQAAGREIDRLLREAAERNDLATFQALLARGADVNARNADQDSAFLLAARNGHAALVKAALAAGADLEALNRYGSTALMGPSYRGQEVVVRQLLAAGAR